MNEKIQIESCGEVGSDRWEYGVCVNGIRKKAFVAQKFEYSYMTWDEGIRGLEVKKNMKDFSLNEIRKVDNEILGRTSKAFKKLSGREPGIDEMDKLILKHKPYVFEKEKLVSFA
jgi:hypothetical protein